MVSRPLVSVLIVNYNGQGVLAECLSTIERMLEVPHEVIVVDNGSSDGGIAPLRARFPQVRFTEHPVNAGFAVGSNLAASVATGEFLLLLNNDTQVTQDLRSWIDLLLHDPTIGVAGCRMSNGSGVLQESIGQEGTLWRLCTMWLPFPSSWRVGERFRLLAPRRDPRYDLPRVDVPWVSAAALLTRRALWEELGGMDPGYFMYFEDVDYCDRVRALGHRVVYSGTTRITHLVGGGKVWGGPLAIQRFGDSVIWYGRRRFGTSAARVLRVVVPFLFLVRSLAYAVSALVKRDPHRRPQAIALAKTALRVAVGTDRHR